MIALPVGEKVVCGLPVRVMLDNRRIWELWSLGDQVHCVQLGYDRVSPLLSLSQGARRRVILEIHQPLCRSRISTHYIVLVEPLRSPS